MSRNRLISAYFIIFVAALCLPEEAMCSGVTLTQAVTSSLRYDSNANIETKDKRSGDFVLIVAPSFSIINERGRVTLTGSYTPSGYVYFKNQSLDNITQSASVDMKAALSEKTMLDLNDSLSYTKESLEATLTGIQTSRGSIFGNTATLGISHSFTPRTSVTLGLSDSMLSSNITSFVDSRTDVASAGIGFSATPNTSLSASYSVSQFSFLSAGGTNSVLDHSAMAGFSHKFPYSLEFSLSGGVSYTPEISTDSYVFIGSAGVRKSFEKSSVGFAFSRGVSNTSGLTNEINIHDGYSLDWKYNLTETVDVGLSGSYSKNKTRPATVVDINSYAAGITGSWRPYSWMGLSAGFTHFQQWAATGSLGSDITRNGVFVSVSVTTYERRF